MPDYYVDRLRRMLRLNAEHDMVKDGHRILELGTGWLHWDALTFRLFYDVESVLFDVWDNRQLGGLRNYFGQLERLIESGTLSISHERMARARRVLKSILSAATFEELYKMLECRYVVEPSGSLGQFSDASFQVVVSAGVLEHIKRPQVPRLFAEMRRVLVPRGWASHSVDTSDHLAHYDRDVSPKLYLRFSDTVWKQFFENEVQYINRIQRCQWLQMARDAGLELIEEEPKRRPLRSVIPHAQYAGLDPIDLECTVLRLLLQRP